MSSVAAINWGQNITPKAERRTVTPLHIYNEINLVWSVFAELEVTHHNRVVLGGELFLCAIDVRVNERELPCLLEC